MANQLKVADVLAIRALVERGWSYRRIARELGVHRETVARHAPKPAKVPTGSDPPGAVKNADSAGSKPATSARRVGCPTAASRSTCEPHRELILGLLEQGLSGQRIWQDLRAEHGIDVGYDSVKRFVRRLGQASPLPFRRMECRPGEEAQLDFGRGASVLGANGRRRRTWFFRIVLSQLIGALILGDRS